MDPTFGRARWESHRETLDAIRDGDAERAEKSAIDRAMSAMSDLTGGEPVSS
jgi:DNA-binding GntR family transcriptional regulator